VTEAVIDDFKAVDSDAENAENDAWVALCPANGVRETIHEETAIRKPGESIVERCMEQSPLGFPSLLVCGFNSLYGAHLSERTCMKKFFALSESMPQDGSLDRGNHHIPVRSETLHEPLGQSEWPLMRHDQECDQLITEADGGY
jgi:hypothetical protein